MKRKTLDLIKAGALSAVMIISLAACGSGTGSGTGNDAAATDTPVAESSVTQEASDETPTQDIATADTTLAVSTEAATESAAEYATEAAAGASTTAAETQYLTYENGGFKLMVPGEYNDELLIEMPQDDAEGILFKVAEKASVEAAKADYGDEADAYDMGWLFSIGKVTEDEMHEMLCGDMFGKQVIAKDADGNFYIHSGPTDVRLYRANNEEMEKAEEHWSILCEWADSMIESFAYDNPDKLTHATYGNSDVQIYLARIAYQPDVNYTVSTLEYADKGALSPAGVDAAPYVESLLTDATIVYADDQETPDGEYIVLNFPDENTRLDFFYLEGGQNYIRRVYTDEDGESATLYKAIFNDKTLTANGIMDKFVKALAEANGFTQ